MKKNICLLGLFFCISIMGMEAPQGILNQQLGQAVIDKNVAAVRALLAQGVDPNRSTAYGEPVLQYAVLKTQDVAIVKALLDAGADPSQSPELLCDLLKPEVRGAAGDITEYIEIRDILIQHPKTNLNCLKKFGQQRSEITPLMYAVKLEETDLIKKLFKTKRVDINIRNSEGKTVFDYARTKAMRGWLGDVVASYVPGTAAQPKVMREKPMGKMPAAAQPMAGAKRKEAEPMKAFTSEFKAARVEIPAAVPMEATPQVDPFKATINAIMRNDFATAINYLARVGFNINQEDPIFGRILSIAIQRNALPVVQRLMQIPELQINYKGRYGNTPLMMATMSRGPEVVQELLQRKDLLVNEATQSGATALDLAFMNPFNPSAVSQLLRAHGAKTGLELRGGPTPQPQFRMPPKKETTQFDEAVYAKLGVSQSAKPHQILGVPSDATQEQIKTAFRAKTLQWHPDRNNDPMAKEVIQLINWANGMLTGNK